MWGVDDEIRAEIKEVKAKLQSYSGNKTEVADRAVAIVDRVVEMIFKEENILFPMVLETLTEDEWISIAAESDEIGYCLTQPAAIAFSKVLLFMKCLILSITA
jgi:DUF438 domain-containing protein